MSDHHEESRRWRTALLDTALRVQLAVCCVLTLTSAQQPVGRISLTVGYAGAAAIALVATTQRRLGFRVRSATLLFGIYVLWALPLCRLGVATPNCMAYLFLESVLATLLFDGRSGLWITLLSAATLTLSFLLQRMGWAPPRARDWFEVYDATRTLVALRFTFTAAVGSGAAVLGISHLLRRLEQALAARDESLLRVEREHAARVQLVRELEGHEAEFLRARELEVLGRLSGFVAHDFNNALLAIFGATELVQRARSERERDEALAIVRSAASQAASTVKQLSAFTPHVHRPPHPIDPSRVVHSSERLLRILLPKNVELLVTATPTAPICVDEGLLQSALMNLSLNAWDAMREGGRLEIRVRPEGSAADGCVFIEVKDSGVGMDEAVRRRLFTPYQTTKGKLGTGLGLASVRQTVEAAGGTVCVESAVGSGTCVRMSFAAVAAPLPPARETSDVALGLEGKVLVVDGDQAVRRTVATYLRRCGLTTFEAQTHDEALQVTSASAVDVVVMDSVVSGASAAHFLDDLRRCSPGVRVVLCAGGEPSAFGDVEVARCLADATLAKPFALETLVTRLRPLIGAADCTRPLPS